ncbi:MAG: DUF4258 domain-containing protein [Saprospiraceae bacterium]
MNKKLDFRKIGMAIVGIIAVIFGLMKGSDVFPVPETTTEQTAQTEETAQQVIAEKENSTEIVDFEVNEPTEVVETVEENQDEKDKKETEEPVKPKNVTDDSKPGNQRLTYEGKDLILTRHAECRMNCRKISKAEVMEVIDEGKENKRKSNPNDPRCPTIALEDWTEDGQLVRIIVADCDKVAKLITVIDLKNEYDCYCK